MSTTGPDDLGEDTDYGPVDQEVDSDIDDDLDDDPQAEPGTATTDSTPVDPSGPAGGPIIKPS